MVRSRLLAMLFAGMLGGCDAIDREGMILVVDRSYNVSLVGSQAQGLAGPDGMLWKDGSLYFADEADASVRSWSKGGKLRTLAGRNLGISTPEDLATDSAGNIFFTDDDAGGVWQARGEGGARLLAGKGKGVGPTEGIAVAPSGDIVVGDGSRHRILRIARGGEVSIFLGPEHGVSKPEGLAFDEHGNLFIGDNKIDVLYLLGADGKLRPLIRDRDGFSPESIWYSRGILYITDSKHGKLYRYSLDGELQTIAVFGGKLANVAGIAGDEAGNLYVSIQSDLQAKKGYIVRLSRTSAKSHI